MLGRAQHISWYFSLLDGLQRFLYRLRVLTELCYVT